MSRAATGAAITVTPSGKFRTSVHLGDGRRRAADFATEEQASAWRDTALAALSAGQPVPGPHLFRDQTAVTVDPEPAVTPIQRIFAQWWQEHYVDHGAKTATRAKAVQRVWKRHIIPWLIAFEIATGADITREQVRALLAALAGRPHPLQGLPGVHISSDSAPTDSCVTVAQAVDQYGFTRSTVKRWLRQQTLPGAHQQATTGTWLIPLVALNARRAAQGGDATWPPPRPYADGVIDDAWWVLRSVLRFGATRGIDAWQLSFDLDSITVPKTTRPKAGKPMMLTVADAARMARHLHPVHQLTLWLLRLLGLRISEAFGLHLHDLCWEEDRLFIAVRGMGGRSFETFDADGNIVTVPHIDRLKSLPSQRFIPVPRHLTELIYAVIEIFHTDGNGTVDDGQRLIPYLNEGGGQAAFCGAFQRAGWKAQVDTRSMMQRLDATTSLRPPRPQDGRKGYGSQLRQQGVDADTRKLLMGHSPDNSVHERVYMLDDPEMRARLDAIDTLQQRLVQELPDGLAIPTVHKCTTGVQGFTGDRRLAIEAALLARGWVVRPIDTAGQGLLFSEDIAALAGVSAGTARRWLRDGELPASRIVDGGRERWGANKVDVQCFVAALNTGRTLTQVSEALGEDRNTLRQRIHAEDLPVHFAGRVMIVPEATEQILGERVRRFDYLESNWLPVARAHEIATVPARVVKTWVRTRELPYELGRGQRAYVDPQVLASLAAQYVSGVMYRRR